MEFDSEIAKPNLRFNNLNGFAEWKINILATDKLIKPTQPDNEVPNLWLAPRKTQSNMIESNGEIEKIYILPRLSGIYESCFIHLYQIRKFADS